MSLPQYSILIDTVSPTNDYMSSSYNVNAGMVSAYGLITITKHADSRIQIEYKTSEPAIYFWMGSVATINNYGIKLIKIAP